MSTEQEFVESCFPKLKGGNGYTITSEATPIYNCLAWAAGDNEWWWDIDRRLAGVRWPLGVPREYTLATWRQIFQESGFEGCETGTQEAGFEKVAAYVGDDEEPTHAARQLQSGKWTSKLGQSHDIEHDTLDSLEGDEYGKVAFIMKRFREDWI